MPIPANTHPATHDGFQPWRVVGKAWPEACPTQLLRDRFPGSAVRSRTFAVSGFSL